MKISNKVSLAILSASVFLGPIVAHAATSPTLGTATTFSVLANTGITGTATITGNVGNNGVGTQITDLTTANVAPGLIYATNMSGPSEGIIDSNVEIDTTAAYGFLDTGGDNATCHKVDGSLGSDAAGTQLGGKSLAPGVYCADSYLLTGQLTLLGTTGTWVFKSAATITTADGSSVTGGDPCNVWWRIVTSAEIFSNTSFIGTIIAHTGIHVHGSTGFTLNGRALAEGADVTLNSGGTISGPTCTAVATSLGSSSINVPIFPLINVTKIPSPLNLPAGPGPVTYTYKVTNLGIVPVTNVSVTDNMCSPTHFVSGDTNNDGILDLTETWTYNCFKTVSQTETNTVVACGSAKNTSSSGNICDSAQATVVVGVPLIPPLSIS